MGLLTCWTSSFTIVGFIGCSFSERNYNPSLLPTFMREETLAASGTPIFQHYRQTPSENRYTSASPFQCELPCRTDEDSKIVQTLFSPSREPSKPMSPAGVTLDQAINECLASDAKLRANWELVEQAQADLLTSSLPPNPTLTTDGIFLPFRRFTPERPGGPSQTDIQVGFPIDWFLFGKRAAAIRNGQLGVDVTAADYADFVRQRILGTITAYYDVLENTALLDVARENLTNLQRVETMTQERIALGGVGTIELDRIRLALIDAQREVRKSESALAAAKSTLQAQLGRSTIDANFSVKGTLAVEQTAAPLAAEDALTLAGENRPDIISLQRQVARAEAALRVEETKAYPSITPAAAVSRQYQGSQGSPDAPSYDLYLNVTLPLFDRNQGNIRKAQSALVQANHTLQGQLVDLRSEIEQAVQDFKVAHANVTADDPKQLDAAKNVRDKIEAAYRVGGRPLLDVLDAQRTYRDTYKLFINGQANYWRSLYRLNAAVGKQVLR
jgi:cobalt-zinc-cadmium efflux system outer membrane protein